MSKNSIIEREGRDASADPLNALLQAGATAHHLYRQLVAAGHDCQVVAPSQIPHKPGERIKTDRRDALKPAQYFRSGNLTAVWRTLVRAKSVSTGG